MDAGPSPRLGQHTDSTYNNTCSSVAYWYFLRPMRFIRLM